jgi:hypothetical protein
VTKKKVFITCQLANLLDSDGNMQNEMMVMAFAATMLATIPGKSPHASLKKHSHERNIISKKQVSA